MPVGFVRSFERYLGNRVPRRNHVSGLVDFSRQNLRAIDVHTEVDFSTGVKVDESNQLERRRVEFELKFFASLANKTFWKRLARVELTAGAADDASTNLALFLLAQENLVIFTHDAKCCDFHTGV